MGSLICECTGLVYEIVPLEHVALIYNSILYAFEYDVSDEIE